EKQKHKTLVLWTIECAKHVLPIFEQKYPLNKRPRKAVEAAKAWAQGKIKMPVAKKAALAAHNAATAVVEKDSAACAAARAMGHVVGTIHVETHAMGFVIYAITAFIYAAKQKNVDDVIAEECKWLYDRLLYWEAHIDKVDTTWAPFLLKDNVSNKEKLLRKKKENKKNSYPNKNVNGLPK
ncbi:MAG: putative immunity protein, partial [Candidatus Woesearchaeota archaeon]